MGYRELLFRITVSFFVLFLLTRIMGRKEISQMTFSNFVSAIAIGKIAGTLALVPEWLEQQLKQAGIQDITNVLYAEIQQDGSLYINQKSNILH